MHRRPTRGRLLMGAGLAIIAAASLAAPAAATFPGRNGLLTFMRQDADGLWQTWVARADLTHAVQLTHGPANNGWSAWSPDASRLAINTDVHDPDRTDGFEVWDIVTVNPDGTRPQKLTDSVGYSGDQAYSPDGNLIAFDADRGDWPSKAGIYVMDADDGRHRRRITSIPAGVDWDSSPRFSPDGKRLVFTRFFAASTSPDGQVVGPHSALYVVRLDGSDLRRITPWGLSPGDGDWSPDGTRIVFELDQLFNGRGDAYVVGADGRGLRNLTKQPIVPGVWEGFSDPIWSPDGKLILVGHGIHHDDGSFTGGLARIRPDGTHLEFVSDGSAGFEHQVNWAGAKGH